MEVLESLKEGDFGPCEKEIEEYVEACSRKFPHAVAFKPPAPELPEVVENHDVEDTTLQSQDIALNVNNWVEWTVSRLSHVQGVCLILRWISRSPSLFIPGFLNFEFGFACKIIREVVVAILLLLQ